MYKRLNDLAKILNENFDSPYIVSLAKELKDNGLLTKLEELPLYSIVVKSKKKELGDLVKAFEKIGKVIEVEPANIDSGIKIAINNHAEKNQKFKEKMSAKLKETLGNKANDPAEAGVTSKPKIEITPDVAQQDQAGNWFKNNKKAAILVSILTILTAGFAYYNKANKSANEDKYRNTETSFVRTA